MSRPRLRNGAPLDISPALSATDRRRQLRRSEPRPLVAADPRPLVVETEPVRRSAGLRQTTLEESYIQRTPARRQDDGIDDDTYSPMAAPRTLPASVTRSGRRENPPRSTRQSKQQSASQRHDDVTDLSMAEYMQLEKQLEYSGTAGPYKEASRLSLYGLDLTEDDDVLSAATDRGLPPMSRLSDHSSSRLTGHSSSQESVTSYTRSIIVSLLTLITTILQSTWYIVTCPVRWVLSIGSTREGAWCCRVCVRLGGWLHQAIARVVLLDTWMLSRSGDRRGSRACCCWWPLLLLLLLLPFLLVPGSRYFIAPITTKESAGAVPVVGLADSDKVVMTTAAAEGIALRELIEKELVVAKADLKSHDSALYQDNLAHMTRLETQLAGLRADIATLEDAQTALVARLAGCCKNDSQLAGLVKTGVTEQLATIMLGGGAAGSADPNPDSSADGASTSAFAAWLNGQFARPGDFDAKIAVLTETLNKGLREQAEASRQAALLAAGAQVTADGAVTEAGRAAGLAGAIRESQDTQSSAWTQDKDSLSALVAGVAGDMKARDDQLAGDVAAAAALAATAAGAAQEAKVLAAEVKAERTVDAEREAVVGTEAAGSAAGVGIGVGTGCGCDSKTFVIPDTYQAITEEQVKLLIREALGIFGADKTGMVDYALESAGGSVISTRCSETFHRRTAQLSLFGIPLWYTSNSPRTVIQPEVHPGQCWAFRGTHGYLVVQLAGLVRPTAFSLEHIPKVLSPSGQIDSAPKAFSVWGLKHERDVDGTLFGNYTYLDNNEPLQFFPVADSSVDAFHIIELRIHGNHGNQDYTCLYRFRVHGVLKRS